MCGFSAVLPLALRAAQKTNSGGGSNPIRTPVLVTIVVRDSAGATLGQTPNVQLYGESQDGTVYTGSPRYKGDEWTFQVPGLGTYTVEVSAPGYKTTHRMVTVSSSTENPHVEVILEPDAHRALVRGGSILAPRAREELQKGKAALGEKHFDEAKSHLENALRLAPSSPDVNYYVGLLAYYTGNRKSALEYLQKTVSLDPDNGPAFLALGEVYYLEKDYARTANVLEQGLALQPDSWRAESVLGSAYYKQADYERGREHAQKALTIGKDEASGTGFLLGKCLAALGRTMEAIEVLEAFVAQQPASDLTKSAQSMLKELRASR